MNKKAVAGLMSVMVLSGLMVSACGVEDSETVHAKGREVASLLDKDMGKAESAKEDKAKAEEKAKEEKAKAEEKAKEEEKVKAEEEAKQAKAEEAKAEEEAKQSEEQVVAHQESTDEWDSGSTEGGYVESGNSSNNTATSSSNGGTSTVNASSSQGSNGGSTNQAQSPQSAPAQSSPAPKPVEQPAPKPVEQPAPEQSKPNNNAWVQTGEGSYEREAGEGTTEYWQDGDSFTVSGQGSWDGIIEEGKLYLPK